MQFALGAEARAAGYRIEAHETIGSTNDEALSRLRDGDAGRLWVVSAHQSAGRGRRGNRWGTPVGNLAASLGLVVGYPASTAASLGFVAGLSLDRALRRCISVLAAGDTQDRLRLKWPNDVLLDSGKLAGILLEAEPVANGRLAVAVGIGVNVVAAPHDLPYRASSVMSLTDEVDAAVLFRELSDAWVVLDRMWNGGAGFASIRERWLDRAACAGEEITVRLGRDVLHGVFESIDDAGRLILRLDGGAVRKVAAGDVHFGDLTAASA